MAHSFESSNRLIFFKPDDEDTDDSSYRAAKWRQDRVEARKRQPINPNTGEQDDAPQFFTWDIVKTRK